MQFRDEASARMQAGNYTSATYLIWWLPQRRTFNAFGYNGAGGAISPSRYERRCGHDIAVLDESGVKIMKCDFSRRSHQLEMMDGDAIAFEDFRNCLRDLEIVNVCTLAYRPTLRWLKQSLRADKSRRPVSILDIGCGGGGMLRKIWNWTQRCGRETDLIGVDLNPWSKPTAEHVTPLDAPIRYETSDVFSFDPNRRADFIISSLFTHHLTDGQVVKFLRWMDQHATRGWFINDLHRHPLPFFLLRYVLHIGAFDPMVQNDGPISVARAFTAADWQRLIAEAGIPPARVSIDWFFPFRYCVAGTTT